jgi:tRNA G18 (ribose-2'-O)-methylase SpoU
VRGGIGGEQPGAVPGAGGGRRGAVGVGPQRLDDASDPRLDGYRRLVDAPFRARLEGDRGLLVAEGVLAASRLVASPYPVVSLLVAEPRLGGVGELVSSVLDAGAPVYLAPRKVMDAVAGYPVHRGVLALGRRVGRQAVAAAGEILAGGGLVLAAEGISDGENMGALLRNAAAFAVAGVVLDPTCCDPLTRRAVRVSVGHALGVPLARSRRWPQDLSAAGRAGAAVVALTPRPEAPALADVLATASAGCPSTLVLVAGAEGTGLPTPTMDACRWRARVPMSGPVDSLNVATAAAVALYEVRRSLGDGRR